MTRRQQEIVKAAEAMIERYGRQAGRQVGQRIEELEANNEGEALQMWREILVEVRRQLQTRGNGRTSLN